MTGDKIFIATRLRNRLLNAVYQRSIEAERGNSERLNDTEVKACKVSLKAIMRGHFRLAEKILLACHDIWRASVSPRT